MSRLLVLAACLAFGVGCQSQNPFAAFGSPRVPPPMAQMVVPGSSAGGTASLPTKTPPLLTPPASGSRAAAAAPVDAVAASPASSFMPDPADREPIRIVENPPAAARTASSSGRSGGAANGSTSSSTTASGAQVPAQPPAPPRSSYAPATNSPAYRRTRGFLQDAAVAPAAYQQADPAFTETLSTDAGQWRAR